jgi:hypothetical protein
MKRLLTVRLDALQSMFRGESAPKGQLLSLKEAKKQNVSP